MPHIIGPTSASSAGKPIWREYVPGTLALGPAGQDASDRGKADIFKVTKQVQL